MKNNFFFFHTVTENKKKNWFQTMSIIFQHFIVNLSARFNEKAISMKSKNCHILVQSIPYFMILNRLEKKKNRLSYCHGVVMVLHTLWLVEKNPAPTS